MLYQYECREWQEALDILDQTEGEKNPVGKNITADIQKMEDDNEDLELLDKNVCDFMESSDMSVSRTVTQFSCCVLELI